MSIELYMINFNTYRFLSLARLKVTRLDSWLNALSERVGKSFEFLNGSSPIFCPSFVSKITGFTTFRGLEKPNGKEVNTHQNPSQKKRIL